MRRLGGDTSRSEHQEVRLRGFGASLIGRALPKERNLINRLSSLFPSSPSSRLSAVPFKAAAASSVLRNLVSLSPRLDSAVISF